MFYNIQENTNPNTKGKKNRKVLDRLLSYTSKCHYCKQRVLITSQPNGVQRHNTATVDHVYSHNDIRRLIDNNHKKVVLACNKCNNSRNEVENQWQKEESKIREESKSFLLTSLLTNKENLIIL